MPIAAWPPDRLDDDHDDVNHHTNPSASSPPPASLQHDPLSPLLHHLHLHAAPPISDGDWSDPVRLENTLDASASLIDSQNPFSDRVARRLSLSELRGEDLDDATSRVDAGVGGSEDDGSASAVLIDSHDDVYEGHAKRKQKSWLEWGGLSSSPMSEAAEDESRSEKGSEYNDEDDDDEDDDDEEAGENASRVSVQQPKQYRRRRGRVAEGRRSSDHFERGPLRSLRRTPSAMRQSTDASPSPGDLSVRDDNAIAEEEELIESLSYFDTLRREPIVGVDGEEENFDSVSASSTLPFGTQPSPPKKQEYIIDDESRVVISGRVPSFPRTLVYVTLNALTLGIFYLACRWLPRLAVRMTTKSSTLAGAKSVFIASQWGEMQEEVISVVPYEGSIADVFPGSVVGDKISNGVVKQIKTLRMFEYRYHRFIMNPVTMKFERVDSWRDPAWGTVTKALDGIRSERVVERRRIVFGRNEVDVKEKSTFRLLVDEVLHPFFVFQIFSIILWTLDDYYYYATTIFLISVASAVQTLVETKATMKRMKEMSRFTCKVRVWRNKQWVWLDSEDVVPGDILELSLATGASAMFNGVPNITNIVPCDAILLDGDCIVNESMLTGESVPVSKVSISDEDLQTLDFSNEDPISSSRVSRFFLFSGTKIIRVRPGQRHSSLPRNYDSDAALNFSRASSSSAPQAPPPGALVMVVRVGFGTTKGSLVRSMLFPKPNDFKFYRDSFKFIGVLACVSAVGFVFASANFLALGVSWWTIVRRALDLVTIVVPPALPATMAIGTSFAIERLRRSGIFCISPPRVIVCGKVDVMCFDKTGTLTQEGLDVLGFRHTVSPEQGEGEPGRHATFSKLHKSIHDLSASMAGGFPGGSSSAHQYPPSRSNSTSLDAGSYKTSMDALGETPRKWKAQNVEHIVTGPTTHSRKSTDGRGYSDGSDSAGQPDISDPSFPYPLIVCAMATCHSIKVVETEPIGDPLDLKMFEFTGWQIEEGGGAGGVPSGGAGTTATPSSVPQGSVSMVVRPPGNPLDLGQLVRGSNTDSVPEAAYTEFGVIRQFEFVSNLRRMSVIVRRLRIRKGGPLSPLSPNDPPIPGVGGIEMAPTKCMEVFAKGAPEVMRSICVPESLPEDYDSLLRAYAHHGYRVLALAWRTLDANVSWIKAMRMKRDEIERDLRFVGFIVFENKLKSGTSRVVGALRRARIREVMCTGDNVLTAISVSRECGLVDREEKCFVPRMVGSAEEGWDGNGPVPIFWEDVDEGEDPSEGRFALDPVSLKPMKWAPVQSPKSDYSSPTYIPSLDTLHPNRPEPTENANLYTATSSPRSAALSLSDSVARVVPNGGGLSIEVKSDGDGYGWVPMEIGNYSLAVTGDVFHWMMEYMPVECFRRMLVKGQIYARMSPEQKQQLMERLQELGYTVGFCGDGANDCGALKAADIGLSLSEAEASVAAPFTSRSTELDCVLEVIREGRAALVTSFSCFQYMALYSLIQFTSVSLLYALASNLGDFQFLYIDLALIIPVAILMGQSKAFEKIVAKRPTASLVSKRVLTSLSGQVTVAVAFQVIGFVWVRRQPWYTPPDVDVDLKKFACFENEALFLLSCFQYIFVAVVVSVGPPYRETMWKNVPFICVVLALLVSTTLLTLFHVPWLSKLLDLTNPTPLYGRLFILCLAFVNFIFSWTTEAWITPALSKLLSHVSLQILASKAPTGPATGETSVSNSWNVESVGALRKQNKSWRRFLPWARSSSTASLSVRRVRRRRKRGGYIPLEHVADAREDGESRRSQTELGGTGSQRVSVATSAGEEGSPLVSRHSANEEDDEEDMEEFGGDGSDEGSLNEVVVLDGGRGQSAGGDWRAREMAREWETKSRQGWAKKERWRSKGKMFKVILAEMRD
ncbi:hypothetical protein BJ742DRAFT_825014 [Cladochytrium replicatum]|nr:hypothetical protein BJ742DRAFT_825014 [Cladochytrium replicatum]